MSEIPSTVQTEREMLIEAREKGTGATIGTYVKLSGPGWLQSAITLGGGSLASSLYLGVIGGYHLMWVQPLAMILGIIMLSAIGYVTLTTERRPFPAINRHINPVLGWGWALAVAAANIVWCLPQYTLANGVLSQNILPSVFGDGKVEPVGWIQEKAAVSAAEGSFWAVYADELVVAISVFLISVLVTWSYDRGGWGVRLYETMLKVMVGLIVICFFIVVIVLATSEAGLPWATIGEGFIPNFAAFTQPSVSFAPLLSDIGEPDSVVRTFWEGWIVDQQQDVIIAAAATAVGINMTFLFAYSLLRKRWTKEFRGLLRFDLATGMLIPFLLATSCVVIASAAQFHTQAPKGFEFSNEEVVVPDQWKGQFEGLLAARTAALEEASEGGDGEVASIPEISLAEQRLAASLVKRDGGDLSLALEPAGKWVANYVFGIGVLAMTLSTITILMLISGFVCCELVGLPQGGWPHRIGTLLPAFLGALGPFIWKDAAFYLAVPTSVFGFVLLPLAYLTFYCMMNSKELLGKEMPRGASRVAWNIAMALSAGTATAGSIYMAYQKCSQQWGRAGGIGALVGIALFVGLVGLVHFNRKNSAKYGDATLIEAVRKSTAGDGS